MMWYSFFVTSIAVLALSTTAARAELFTGSFTGTTSDGLIYAGPLGADYFGISVAPNQTQSLAGLSVSGTISYDTATTFPSWEEGHLVIPETGQNYLSGYYPSLPFTITETINGISFAVTGSTYSGVAIAQLDGINQGSGFEVQNEGGPTPDGKGTISPWPYPRDDASVGIFGAGQILSNFNDLNSLNISSLAGLAPAETNASYESADGSFFFFDAPLTSLDVEPAVSPIPIPSPLPAFAASIAGLAALGFARSSRVTCDAR